MERRDDFLQRRQHLAGLTNEELKERFWALAEEITEPLLSLGKVNTSPSIERSVLLRMGFSSLEAAGIVERCLDRGLLSKGAGHVVYKLALMKEMDIRQAGLALLRDEHWDAVEEAFRAGYGEGGKAK